MKSELHVAAADTAASGSSSGKARKLLVLKQSHIPEQKPPWEVSAFMDVTLEKGRSRSHHMQGHPPVPTHFSRLQARPASSPFTVLWGSFNKTSSASRWLFSPSLHTTHQTATNADWNSRWLWRASISRLGFMKPAAHTQADKKTVKYNISDHAGQQRCSAKKEMQR